MENLLKLYGDQFFGEDAVHRRNWAVEISKRFASKYPMESVVDFGCGIGSYLEGFQAAGTKSLKGYELCLSNAAKYISPKVAGCIEEKDISIPIPCEKKYDCAISVEVAEHIPSETSDILVNNLVAHADKMILFTAAPPEQKAPGHINCQPKDFWAAKFFNRGWKLDEYMVENVKSLWFGIPPAYITMNLMIFRPTSSQNILERIYTAKTDNPNESNFIIKECVQLDTYGLRSLDKDVKYFVDLGANIGISSLWAAYCFPEATILAVEPDMKNYSLLLKNTAGIDKIIPIHKAFGVDGTRLYQGNDLQGTWGAWFVREPNGTEGIECMSLAGLEFPITDKFYLKFDCEGGEKFLLDETNLRYLRAAYAIGGEYHFNSNLANHDIPTFEDVLLIQKHIEEQHQIIKFGKNDNRAEVFAVRRSS